MTINDAIQQREKEINEWFSDLRLMGYEKHVNALRQLFNEIRQLEKEKYHFEYNRELFDNQ